MKNTYKSQYKNNTSINHAIHKGFAIWAVLIISGLGLVNSQLHNLFTADNVKASTLPVAPFNDHLEDIMPTTTVIIVNKASWGKIKAPRVSDVSAYTSRVQETDATPCIPADGSNICERHAKGEKMVASNCYKLGTKLKIGDLGTFTVVDRMARRYTASCRVDIYMGYDLKGALNFGVKQLMVTEL